MRAEDPGALGPRHLRHHQQHEPGLPARHVHWLHLLLRPRAGGHSQAARRAGPEHAGATRSDAVLQAEAPGGVWIGDEIELPTR